MQIISDNFSQAFISFYFIHDSSDGSKILLLCNMFTVNLWDSKKDVDTETWNFERCLDQDYDDDVENKTS